MQTALAIIAAYLVGSIPFAMISSKIFGLADPRTYGSGNPGATNVLRSGNKKAALFTLIGDALKGTLAVVVAKQMGLDDTTIALVALAVFLGHLYPVFLGFKGGKGVATAAGVLFALDPILGAAVAGTLLGRPIAFSEFASAPGSKGDLMLCDFQCYGVATRRGVAIASSEHARFGRDQMVWKVTYRGDGQPLLDAPVKLADGANTQVSPFVILN